MIAFLDITTLLLLLAVLILLLVRLLRDQRKSRFVLLIAFLFLFISAYFNIPENIIHTTRFDDMEVFFDLLFIPTLILAIHISTINRELKIRRLSEQQFRAIFSQAFSLVGLLDSEGRILDANEKALKMIDQSLSEVRGRDFSQSRWWEHSSEEQGKLQDALEKAKSGLTVRFETSHRDVNNGLRAIDMTITPVLSDSGEPENFIVEGRDITDLKETQVELQKHKYQLEGLVREKTEELESANEELKSTLTDLKEAQSQLVQSEKMASLGTLTSGVAHEINNPLNYIMGAYVGLEDYFRKSGSSEEDKTRVLLESIKIGLEKASGIIRVLNQFSSHSEIRDESCDIHRILDNCLLLMKNQLKPSQQIQKDYTNETIAIRGNSGALHQVFLNILSNASYACNENGLIKIGTEREGEFLAVYISDNGCGIREEHLDKIADPFFTTKPPGEGTGLGLSIAYSIVREHHGSIIFKSEKDKGTIVKTCLPILKEPSSKDY
ncbi:MAG: PAS domain-containing sensor histidine kinase [Bacteroidota bacterium]